MALPAVWWREVGHLNLSVCPSPPPPLPAGLSLARTADQLRELFVNSCPEDGGTLSSPSPRLLLEIGGGCSTVGGNAEPSNVHNLWEQAAPGDGHGR